MNLEFKKVTRVCPHNDNIVAGKPNDRYAPGAKTMIYDYNVMVDGEHRATFAKSTSFRGYILKMPDLHDNMERMNSAGAVRSVVVTKKSLFDSVIRQMIASKELLTAAQIKKQLTLKEERKEKELEQAIARNIELAKTCRASDMYYFLRKIFPFESKGQHVLSQDDMEEARRALDYIDAKIDEARNPTKGL